MSALADAVEILVIPVTGLSWPADLTPVKTRDVMQWRWFIWSFIPGVHWMAWFQAGILAHYPRYYWFGLGYALPLFLFLITKRLSLRLVVLSWLLGLLHAHLYKRDINRRIEEVLSAGTTHESLRQALLQAALEYRGCLSVTQAVMETGKPFAEIERTLDQMVESGYVFTRNNPETGVIEYVFKEFL